MNKLLNNNIVEICETEEDKLAGRIKIKLIAHEIYHDTINDEEAQTNRNGISWREEWTKLNLNTCINMPLVVSYIDKETGLIAGHGDMETYSDAKDGEGIEFKNSEVVGTVYNAYITDIEIDNVTKKVLMLEGYIYNQRNLGLVKFLREQVNEMNNTICGSIEINADSEHDEIIYLNGKYNEDGSLNMHRIPQYYAYSAHAILYLEKEADPSAVVVEMNSIQDINKEGEHNKMSKVLAKSTSIEINKITVYELYDTIIDHVNEVLSKNYKYDTWIYELYIDTGEVVIKDDSLKDKFYMTTFKFENGNVIIGDVVEVENTWIPVSKSTPVEINKCKKDNECNEDDEEKNACGKKKECNTDMNQEELNAKIAELNSKLEGVDTKISELNSVIEEKEAKIAELNEVIVENTKTITELTEKNTANEAELNSCKEKVQAYEKAEAEAKAEAELNAYMKEIEGLKLSEAELNSVNSVETIEEKKAKVSEICIARCMNKAKADAEVNSKEVEVNSAMFNIPEPKKEVLDGEVPSIW